MKDEDHRRWVHLNLPHARTVVQRVSARSRRRGRSGRRATATPPLSPRPSTRSSSACAASTRTRRPEEALRAADEAAALARALVEAVLATPARGDRLGQHVRNLFECLGLAEEGARLAAALRGAPRLPPALGSRHHPVDRAGDRLRGDAVGDLVRVLVVGAVDHEEPPVEPAVGGSRSTTCAPASAAAWATFAWTSANG